MAENCIFCKIIRKEEPANIVYDDGEVVAFLSNRPVNVGHTLVIPKKHYPDIFDIPESEAGHLFSITKRLAHAVRDSVNAEGIRIVQNNGEAAGQVVYHMHIHIIPLKPHDDLHNSGVYRNQTNPRNIKDLEEDAKKIRVRI